MLPCPKLAKALGYPMGPVANRERALIIECSEAGLQAEHKREARAMRPLALAEAQVSNARTVIEGRDAHQPSRNPSG